MKGSITYHTRKEGIIAACNYLAAKGIGVLKIKKTRNCNCRYLDVDSGIDITWSYRSISNEKDSNNSNSSDSSN